MRGLSPAVWQLPSGKLHGPPGLPRAVTLYGTLAAMGSIESELDSDDTVDERLSRA
jgi:hypothetical protein